MTMAAACSIYETSDVRILCRYIINYNNNTAVFNLNIIITFILNTCIVYI